jgi:hypothetical protein
MKFKIVSESYELSTPCQNEPIAPILMNLIGIGGVLIVILSRRD